LVHDGKREAGIHPLSIDKHCAGTARALVAALLGVGQANELTQGIE
jgi:hypothetical protein